MKIGYLSDIFPKTSETFVLNEIAGLSASNAIRVFAMISQGGTVPDKVEVTYFKRRFVKDGVSSLKAGLKNELLSRSAKEHYYKMVAQYFSTFSKDVDILHRHFATNSIVYYLAREQDVPYTVTTHAWDIFAQNRYVHVKAVLENAARVITISDYNKRYLIDNLGIKEENIEVVRMGIDPHRFKPTQIEGDKMKVLSVGRLIEKKGFIYAIDALSIVASKYPDIQYTIIGSGPEEEKLLLAVKRLDLENNVRIIGDVSDEMLLKEYNEAGMFVLPCVQAKDGDLDGIPVAIMEAMAMKKPVISTNVSGIPELIASGSCGLLVEPKNPQALASAMEDIIAERVDHKSMAEKGRKTVIEKFSLENQIHHMNGIFSNVMDLG